MRNVTKILLVLSVFAIGFAGCSKEKKIERQLVKKEGEWRITSLDYKYYQFNELAYSVNFPNVGTIEFNKNGSVTMTTQLSGSPETAAGTWSNSDDEVVLVIEGETTVMKIAEGPKKGKLELEQTEYYNDTDEKEIYTYYLEREN